MAVELSNTLMSEGVARRALPGFLMEVLSPPFVLYAPAGLFLIAFFLAPLSLVVWISFSEPTLGFANYVEFFSSKYDLGVLARTFQTALIVTLVSLIFAYPGMSPRGRGVGLEPFSLGSSRSASG